MNEPWDECPKCGGQVRGNYANFDTEQVWRTMRCNTCGFKWNEVYNFWRNENVNTTEELDEKGNPISEKSLTK